jgi:hypothetical protein
MSVGPQCAWKLVNPLGTMLLQAVIGACLETLEDFSIGSLDLSITLWMSIERIGDLASKILTVSLKWAAGELGLIVGDDPVQDPEPRDDGLDELDCGLPADLDHMVTSCHLVNLSMATYKYRNPPTAMGNGPRMSSPHTTNGHEGGIIYSVCTSVWIRLA